MSQASIAVPFLDPEAQYRRIQAEVDAAMQRVAASQDLADGQEVAGFESGLAQHCQVGHCVGVASGSDTLRLALMAMNVGPGDEVITTAYACVATASAIVQLGARPVFVDIDPAAYTIDPAGIEARVTARTRAIIPVHVFGQCADMDPILALARRHGLAVIEDAAQALGAQYKGNQAGSMGTVGCFSFHLSQAIGAFGECGAVVTNDTALADKIRVLCKQGGNFRLDAIHAAVLQVKLRHLDGWVSRRQQNAGFYDTAFSRLGLRGRVVGTPAVVQSRHIFSEYVVRLAERDAVRAHLTAQEVATDVCYPTPLHMQECFRSLGYREGDFPESENAAVTTLALPIYPELSLAQRHRVVNAVASYFEPEGHSSRRHAA